MSDKLIWPSSSISKVWRGVFIVGLFAAFGCFLLFKYSATGMNKQVGLNSIIFIYSLIACYGFLFDKDIPAPPLSGAFDSSNVNLQYVRFAVFIISIISLCLVTFLL